MKAEQHGEGEKTRTHCRADDDYFGGDNWHLYPLPDPICQLQAILRQTDGC